VLNMKVVTWSLGIWAAFTFVFCVVYGLLTPSSMHMYALLEQVLPGFKWLTWWVFRTDRGNFVRRIRGTRLRAHLQFYARGG
jgi:hypothetical protein